MLAASLRQSTSGLLWNIAQRQPQALLKKSSSAPASMAASALPMGVVGQRDNLRLPARAHLKRTPARKLQKMRSGLPGNKGIPRAEALRGSLILRAMVWAILWAMVWIFVWIHGNEVEAWCVHGCHDTIARR